MECRSLTHFQEKLTSLQAKWFLQKKFFKNNIKRVTVWKKAVKEKKSLYEVYKHISSSSFFLQLPHT